MPGISREEDILNEKYRQIVIKEITDSDNVARKNKSLRAHEIYNDKTKKWVVESLKKEFSTETVLQMMNRASNISILKKVAKKLAQAYQAGVSRKGANDTETKLIEDYAKTVKLNSVMKKSDRWLYIHKNACIAVIPEWDYREEKYHVQPKVLAPHQYDVIADERNPESARVLILTEFVERINAQVIQPDLGPDGRSGTVINLHEGDGTEEAISIDAADQGQEKREFIWWSDNYHFTTNEKGEILPAKSGEGNKNPVGILPAIFLHEDRDGYFWAPGGDDLVDGAVMINVELTDLYTIKNVQGWGQPVFVGDIRDTNVSGGPHNAIFLKQQTGEPEPKFYYASSNPPLDRHMKSIEMTTALYLSTNNLSPTNVAGKLDAQSFPSGIAKMVEDAQSNEPVEDKQAYFKDDVEPALWGLLARWQNQLFDRDALVKKQKDLGKLPPEPKLTLEYGKKGLVTTEKEKLENMKLRKEGGWNTQAELIAQDRNIDVKEAEKIAKTISEEAKERMAEAVPPGADDPKAGTEIHEDKPVPKPKSPFGPPKADAQEEDSDT